MSTINKVVSQHIPWKEYLLHIEAQADEWDEMWEALGESEGGQQTITRTPTPMPNFQRHNGVRRVAAASDWRKQVTDAQSHVSGILGKLGNF